MPFKIGTGTIVVLKDLPLLQCVTCGDYLLEDPVMARVEEILSQANRDAELEILSYAA
jgi:hypothetical protein